MTSILYCAMMLLTYLNVFRDKLLGLKDALNKLSSSFMMMDMLVQVHLMVPECRQSLSENPTGENDVPSSSDTYISTDFDTDCSAESFRFLPSGK